MNRQRAQETLMSSESRGGALEKIVTEELAPHRERIHIRPTGNDRR
jgi:hypothetical protein